MSYHMMVTGFWYNISCIWSALVFYSIDQIILLTLSRAWGCLPRPYTCHTLFVSHPLMGTILIQKPKSSMPQPRKHHLSPENPMMFVGHTMSSCPHTSRGNMLTQKIPQWSLHDLHHLKTSMHNPHLTPTPSERLKNMKRGLKTPKKSQNISHRG